MQRACQHRFQTLGAQVGNFPIFEGTSLYSLRLDHNFTTNNRITLRANVSPSTVTGIEVNGENQTFGQNSFSRTSQQTYRDVAGVFQDTWTIGSNKVNEFRFQYARRGLSYFYSSAPGGSDVAVNIPGFAYFGREPYSYIQRTEQRYQFTDNFSWTLGRHDMKFGVDFNYIPLTATFTVNYGGVYDFGSLLATQFPGSFQFVPRAAQIIPGFRALASRPRFMQGIGNPNDTFSNKPLGVYLQDSWRVPNLTLNLGVRYDIEFPPKLAPPNPLALTAYNALGLQKGIQTDTNNIQPRIGVAWDPKGNGKVVWRASYRHVLRSPVARLYFLGDASDGSKSGQLLFAGGVPCDTNPVTVSLPESECEQHFPGHSDCAHLHTVAFTTNLGYLPNQQQIRGVEFSPIAVHQSELPEPGIAFPAGVPALRLSPGQEFCVRLFRNRRT